MRRLSPYGNPQAAQRSRDLEARARAIVAGLREPDPADPVEAAAVEAARDDQDARDAAAGQHEIDATYGPTNTAPRRPWSNR